MAAAGVILAGMAGAIAFRRVPAAAPQAPAATAESEVLVRRRPSSGPSGVRSAAPLINQVEAQTPSPTSSPPPSTPAPPERLAKTPSMPPRYNPFSQPPSNSAAPNPPLTTPAFQPSPYAPPPYVPPAAEHTGETPVPPGVAPAGRTPTPPQVQPAPARTHIIVDGDTLTDLAEMYLGSGRRYPEIFEANRDVLQHPDLLPIGARLRIPSDGRVSPPTAKADDLVPIPANAWRRGRGKEP